MVMDEWLRKLPPGACCYALAEQSHPVAFKDVSGRYIGANNAFEDLLGYSRSELVKMRWQDITLAEDIYGEQTSFEQIMQGKSTSYMATKRYRHKMGHYVSVATVVRRWPSESNEKIGCFVVDVVDVSLEVCTLSDLREAREQSRREIDSIKASLAKIMERNEHGDINITAGNTGNSDRTIYALVGAVVVLGIVVIWIAYYVFGNERMTPPPSPRPAANATAAIGAKN